MSVAAQTGSDRQLSFALWIVPRTFDSGTRYYKCTGFVTELS
jgi:hypothetical protein